VQRFTLHRARDTHQTVQPMIRRTRAMAAALAACALLATVAGQAADGEILIDQARVNAGGITPGDAPGFPATLSRPGRYKLAGNLRVPAGQDGIKVTRDNVTIDLNGFTISSNPPGEAFNGVYAGAPINGLRVVSGTITGFGIAIFNDGGLFAVVEHMRLVSNGFGFIGGSDDRVRNSTIASNNASGVTCTGCVIEGSVIADNGFGVTFSFAGGLALGNVIVGNGGAGLRSSFQGPMAGYGDNILFGNNGGGAQVSGKAFQLHPNVCEPAC
jgi:hypothetical protein